MLKYTNWKAMYTACANKLQAAITAMVRELWLVMHVPPIVHLCIVHLFVKLYKK